MHYGPAAPPETPVGRISSVQLLLNGRTKQLLCFAEILNAFATFPAELIGSSVFIGYGAKDNFDALPMIKRGRPLGQARFQK